MIDLYYNLIQLFFIQDFIKILKATNWIFMIEYFDFVILIVKIRIW